VPWTKSEGLLMCLLGYREQGTETPLGKQGESTKGDAGRGVEEYLAGRRKYVA